MLLLPGSLPPDRATLKALCEGLADLPETATVLHSATVTEYLGSWSDAEREASGNPGDLSDAVVLLHLANPANNEAVSVAIATPLHVALGLTDLTPIDPSRLLLSADESRALCEAADAHMREDRVRLHFIDALRWLVTCSETVDVLTERPDWIIGEPLRPNLPRGRDARLVERWMNELQMLLHTHPVNIAREERRLPPVNLVWLWGFGANVARRSEARPGITLGVEMLHAARNGAIASWQAVWTKQASSILMASSIILGDSRPHLRLTTTTSSLAARLLSPFKRKATLTEALAQLQRAL